MKKILLLSLSSLFWLSTLQAQDIDTDNSYVRFTVRSLGKEVEGKMKNLQGTVQLDPNNLAAANFSATVDPSTVETGAKGRDKHLQENEYFGVEEYGVLKMVSKEIKKTATGYEAIALLTIKEVETEIVIPFVMEQQADRQILKGNIELLRKDYNLGSSIGKMLIGLEVQVDLYAEVLP